MKIIRGVFWGDGNYSREYGKFFISGIPNGQKSIWIAADHLTVFQKNSAKNIFWTFFCVKKRRFSQQNRPIKMPKIHLIFSTSHQNFIICRMPIDGKNLIGWTFCFGDFSPLLPIPNRQNAIETVVDDREKISAVLKRKQKKIFDFQKKSNYQKAKGPGFFNIIKRKEG